MTTDRRPLYISFYTDSLRDSYHRAVRRCSFYKVIANSCTTFFDRFVRAPKIIAYQANALR